LLSSVLEPLGLLGAPWRTRYVGGTLSGAPTTGTFAAGDFIIDQTGSVWICTVAGSPGTWARPGGGAATNVSPNRQIQRNIAAGFIDQTWDIFGAASSSGSSSAPSTQSVYGTLAGLVAGDVITNVFVSVSVLGVGTAPTGIYLGLFSKAGVLLASTSNVAASTNWTTTTEIVKFTFTTPYTVPASDGYYFAFLQNGAWGTTALTLLHGNQNSAQMSHTVAGGAGANLAVKQTGQATLPAPATLVNDVTNFWFGWS
jgi:hypothetical protein